MIEANHKFDLVVIGSGIAGLTGARKACSWGKSVAVIEYGDVGGDCLNDGCIPTKSLLTISERILSASDNQLVGLPTSIDIDYDKIQKWLGQVRSTSGAHHLVSDLKSLGVRFFEGQAHFLNTNTISVGGTRIMGSKFLIATGSRLKNTDITGAKESGYYTYKEISKLSKLPKSIVIIGGGSVGCEYAQILSSLGCSVTLIEKQNYLLSVEDIDVGKFVEQNFSRLGIDVYTNSDVSEIKQSYGSKIVTFIQSNIQRVVEAEAVMLSIGKTPNLDLGLENALVDYNEAGISCNQNMQTTNANIFGAGDVVGPYRFSHLAISQASSAVNNMFGRKKTKIDYNAITRSYYLYPEIGVTGMTESDLAQKGQDYQISMVPLNTTNRYNMDVAQDGFVKILANHYGYILGASIIAPRAGDLIHELTLAIKHGVKAQQVALTNHAYPTWSEAVALACAKIK